MATRDGAVRDKRGGSVSDRRWEIGIVIGIAGISLLCGCASIRSRWTGARCDDCHSGSTRVLESADREPSTRLPVSVTVEYADIDSGVQTADAIRQTDTLLAPPAAPPADTSTTPEHSC